MGGYNQDYDILPRAVRDKAEELSLRFNQALGYDMNAIEFALKDGKFYGIDLTNYTPDMDYRASRTPTSPGPSRRWPSSPSRRRSPKSRHRRCRTGRRFSSSRRPLAEGRDSGRQRGPRLRRPGRAGEPQAVPEPRRQLQRRARGALLLPLLEPLPSRPHGLLAALLPLLRLRVLPGQPRCSPSATSSAARAPSRAPTARLPVERFEEAFFFSVQTLATIGYGRLSPHGHAANILVALEALFGLGGFALVTEPPLRPLLAPEARLLFSERAVVAPYRGITGLMFRIANARTSQLLEVEATVTLSRLENVRRPGVRRFHELPLERRRVALLPAALGGRPPHRRGSPLQRRGRRGAGPVRRGDPRLPHGLRRDLLPDRPRPLVLQVPRGGHGRPLRRHVRQAGRRGAWPSTSGASAPSSPRDHPSRVPRGGGRGRGIPPPPAPALDAARFMGFARGFPKRYLEKTPPLEVVRHYGLMEALGRRAVITSLAREGALWQLCVVARDRSFLFARIAGSLSAFGMNIVAAEAFANANALVLDTFRFADKGAGSRTTASGEPSSTCSRRRPRVERSCPSPPRAAPPPARSCPPSTTSPTPSTPAWWWKAPTGSGSCSGSPAPCRRAAAASRSPTSPPRSRACTTSSS